MVFLEGEQKTRRFCCRQLHV